MTIHTDASIYLAELTAGGTARYAIPEGRHVWLQILRGEVAFRGERLVAGDGLAMSDERDLILETDSTAEVMLFDLA